MTCGIYKLNFHSTHKVYIGQSKYIKGRFTRHLREMRQGTSSTKLNNAYIEFGAPYLEVLTECLITDLNTFEMETIQIYNSVEHGFNSYDNTRGKNSVCGQLHYNSKFSEEQILAVFFLLLDPHKRIKDISTDTEVPVGSINCLARGASHTYLSELYPVEYATLMSLVGKRIGIAHTAEAKGLVYPTIVSPEGISYTVHNVADFSKEHNIEKSGLYLVLNKKRNRKTVSGWTLEEYL
jgi:hypothetical protein